jgi:hypothetical protein
VTWAAGGIWNLLLVSLGILAGVALGAPAAPVKPVGVFLGPWSPWVGLALLAIGYLLYQAIPVHTLPWVGSRLVRGNSQLQ